MKDKNKYDQLEMELSKGTLEAITVNEEEKEPREEKIAEKNEEGSRAKKEKFVMPETLSIDEAYMDDDSDEKVSPKSEIFKKFAGKNEGKGYVATFHGADKDEEVKLDSTYESSSHADHQFMETFGLSGSQSTINITDRGGQTSSEIDTLQGDIHSDYYEYTDRLQRKEISGMYKFARKSIKNRMIFASIFALFVLLIENIHIFVKEPSGIFAHPYVLVISNILFFTCCVACAHEQIYHGIRSIFSKDYIPESVAVVSSLCAIVHSLTTLLFVILGTETQPKLFNFPVAFIVVCTILHSYINVVREKYGFSVVSAKDSKFYLEKVGRLDAEAETETFSGTGGEFLGEIVRVKRTGFVKNYFANTNATPNIHSYLGIYYTLALLIPAVLAIVSLFVVENPDFIQTVSFWYQGVLLIIPVGILFTYSVPFLIGNKRLFRDDVAIIGENSVTEFATTDVVSVNDTTAFPPHNVRLTNLQVYPGYKTEKVLYYAASGFALVGGPLADVFDASTKDAFQKSRKTKFVCSGRSFLCVKVDNDTIIFADKYGMSAQGIDVGIEKEEDEEISIMYMACNGSLCSKMYLKYKIDEEFVDIAAFLNRNNVGIGIRTFDPNINNELIRAQAYYKKFDIKVIRLTMEDETPTISAKSEGKIVSKGLSKSLLKAIPVCKRIVNTRKVTRAFKIISSILGGVLLGLAIFGKLIIGASVVLVGYYLALIALMLLTTLIIMPSLK